MHINVTIKFPDRLPRYVVFVGCLAFGLLGSIAVAWANVPNVFKDGDVLNAQALNDNFAATGDPSGSVIAYAGDPTKVPTGWLLCDGSTIQRSMYPALFAAIGTSWGSADGLSFNIPDLRGRFLRGVSGTTKNDPDCATRDVPVGSAATGCNAVGTLQADAIGSHSHTTTIQAQGTQPGVNTPSLGASLNNNGSVTVPSSAAGAAESRPKNAAVAYIIKI
jgi:microcystin-dependent protein